MSILKCLINLLYALAMMYFLLGLYCLGWEELAGWLLFVAGFVHVVFALKFKDYMDHDAATDKFVSINW